jgi:MoxR-like ATPase
MLHLKIGYPDVEQEKLAVAQHSGFELAARLTPVATRQEILKMQAGADEVSVEDSVMDYLMQVITATRKDDRIRLGASTRGAQFLLRAAKAHAYYEGREYVVPDDIKRLASLVLGHRLILKTRKFISDAEQVVRDILENIAVPV